MCRNTKILGRIDCQQSFSNLFIGLKVGFLHLFLPLFEKTEQYFGNTHFPFKWSDGQILMRLKGVRKHTERLKYLGK